MLRLAAQAVDQDITCFTVGVSPAGWDEWRMETFFAPVWRAFSNLTRGSYKLGATNYSTVAGTAVLNCVREGTESSGFRVGIGGAYNAFMRFPFPTWGSGQHEKNLMVALTSFGGYSGPVTLEALEGPSGAIITLGSSTVTLVANETTYIPLNIREINAAVIPEGEHHVTIRATASNGKTSTAVARFDVTHQDSKLWLFQNYTWNNPWMYNAAIPSAVRSSTGGVVHVSPPPTILNHWFAFGRQEICYVGTASNPNLIVPGAGITPGTLLYEYPAGIGLTVPQPATDLISLNVATNTVPGLHPIRVTWLSFVQGQAAIPNGNSGYNQTPSYWATDERILWVLVPKARLGLSVSPGTVTVPAGYSGTATATVTARSSGGGNATLSLRNAPPTGISVAFNPQSVSFSPSSAGTSSVTVTVAPGTAAGDYPVEIVAATAAGAEASTSLLIRVPTSGGGGSSDFALSANPVTRTVARGNQTTVAITVSPVGSFYGSVPLTATGLPSGVTASFSPATVSVYGSPATSTLTLNVGASVSPGIYNVVVNGTVGGNTRSTSMTLFVTAPSFSLSASPEETSVTGGGASSPAITITVNPVNGFTGSVSLQVQGLPVNSGVTYAVTPNPTTNTASLTFDASQGAPGKSYLLTVVGTSGTITASKNVNLTVIVPPPAAPTNLQAQAISTTRVDLTWTDASNNEAGFTLHRRYQTGPSTWSPWLSCGQVGENVTTFSDTSARPATVYQYRVCAYNTGGPSAFSNVASATTPAEPVPDAPTGLIATALGYDRIGLEWHDNSENEQGFYIERRKLPADPWVIIGAVSPNITEYLNAGLTADTTYEYRVCAWNSGGNSTYTNTASARTFAPPVSSRGTDFWLAMPMGWQRAQDATSSSTVPQPLPDYFVVITAEQNTTGVVSIPGIGFSQNFSVAAGVSVKVPLPLNAVVATLDGISNKGVRVTASGPVSVYGMVSVASGPGADYQVYQNFTGSEAFLALPKAALGTEYVSLDYDVMGSNGGSTFVWWQWKNSNAFITVVAAHDNTHVTIIPTQQAGSAPTFRGAGVPYTITLNTGQVYQVQRNHSVAYPIQHFPALTGTSIKSDKPIAVISGTDHAVVGNDQGSSLAPYGYGLNPVMEFLPPVSRWGKDFVATPPVLQRETSQNAYHIGTPLTGNQVWTGSMGLDFNVTSATEVTRLGAFDSDGDGFTTSITVQIYNRATGQAVPGTLMTFTSGAPGSLDGAFRYKDIAPVVLSPGQYSVVAWGFDTANPDGNTGFPGFPNGPSQNTGINQLTFVGSGRFSTTAGVYPPNLDTGPSNRYAGGTFSFRVTDWQWDSSGDYRTLPCGYRVVAAYDGTCVRVNGVVFATLNRGEYADFQANDGREFLGDPAQMATRTPFHFTANQPILVAQYGYGNESSPYPGYFGSSKLTEPYMTLVPAVDQWGSQATTTTMDRAIPTSLYTAPYFLRTYLNIVTTEAALADLRLDGNPLPTGQATLLEGTGYVGISVKVTSGAHTLLSQTGTPFGATSIGINSESDDAYGFPVALTLSEAAPPEPNQAPRVSITAPGNGSVFDATGTLDVPVSVNVSDADGSVVRVEYQLFHGDYPLIDKNLTTTHVTSTPPFSDQFTVTQGPGSYRVRAIAFDNKGGASSAWTQFRVRDPNVNYPPVVEILVPAVSQTNPAVRYGPPAPVSISVTADVTDPEENLTSVDFLLRQGATVRYSLTPAANGSVYSGVFNGVAAGVYQLTVRAQDTGGQVTTKDIPVFVVDGAATPMRINCGGPDYTDNQGNLWVADTSYTGGMASNFNLTTVSGTSDPALYSDFRQGSYYESNFTYAYVTIPGGKVKVKLHYVEGAVTGSGQRTFDVVVNGLHLQSGATEGREDYDIYAEAGGQGIALVDTLDVEADENGFVTIGFWGNYYGSSPIVSAIEFLPDQTQLTCDSSQVAGQLETSDETMTLPGTTGTFYADRYTLEAHNGQNLSLSVSTSSGGFAPYLYLLAPEGYVVAQGSAGTNSSALTYTATREGTYTVVATSAPAAPNVTGAYSLSLNCSANNTNPPNAPTDLIAHAVADEKQLAFSEIELTWRDNSADETGFEVWRKDTPTATAVRVAQLASSAGGQLTWREVNPHGSQQRVYAYIVKAVKGSLASAASNEATVNTYIVPPVVAVLTPLPGAVVASGGVTIKLSASASSGRDIPEAGVVVKDYGVPVSGVTVTRDPNNPNRYDAVWPSAPNGDHHLSVTVTDTGGVPSTSPEQWLAIGSALPATPVIAEAGQFNNGPRIVGISANSPETTIYYTIDYASVPTDGGDPVPGQGNTHKYTGPFVLYRTGSIKARAYRKDQASSIVSQAFSFSTNTVANPGANYGVINRQPDAYYNTFPTSIPGRITGGTVPGVEILTRDSKVWGGIVGQAVGSWNLSYRSLESDTRANSTETEQGWVPLTSGVGSTDAAPLADFDTTILPNGQYELRLRVYNLNYNPVDPNNPAGYADTFRTVVVAGGQKVGPMNLSLVDLTLPAPGFPIQITRSYDSTDKTAGDFGIGWRLGVSNVRVQTSATANDVSGGASSGRSRKLGDGWQQYYGLGQYYLAEQEPHFISISLPGGAVYAFYPKLSEESSSYAFDDFGVHDDLSLRFIPVPGTQADQERPQSTNINSPGTRLYALVNGVPTQDIPVSVMTSAGSPGMPNVQHFNAQLVTGDAFGGDVVDVRQWMLETRDGTRYYLDTDLGITKIVDRNGNEIVYEYEDALGGKRVKTVTSRRHVGNGVTTPTRSVTVNRTNGFVTSLADGNGHSILYTQNAAGDLIKVTNRVLAETNYVYDTRHNLTQVLAPAVTQPGESGPLATIQPTVTSVYDEEGRLTATVDAAGNVTQQGHNTTGKRAVVTDASGKQQMLAYDDVGNVLLTAAYVTEKDAQGVLSPRTVESKAEYGYWVAGDGSNQDLNRFANLKTRQEVQVDHDQVTGAPTMQVTKYGYDSAFGDLTAVSDPRDPSGNTIAQKTVYNGRGQVTEVLDPRIAQANRQLQQKNIYDDQGNLIETRDALGQRTIISDGNPATVDDNLNPDGSPKRVKDPAGNLTTYTYVASGANAGQIEQVVAPGNLTTSFAYQLTGEKLTQAVVRTGQLNEDGTPAATQTLTTSFVYDNEGRLLKTIAPQNQGNPSAVLAHTEYNALGKVTQRVDMDGRATKYIYDGRGMLVKTISSGGAVSQTIYDASGRAVQRIAPGGQISTTVYDTLGRVYESASTDLNGQNPIYSRSQYDDAGRVVKSFESRDGGTTFQQKSYTQYDLAGNVMTSKDTAALVNSLPATEYHYDAQGRNDWTKDARGNYIITEFDSLGRVKRTYLGASGPTPSGDEAYTETDYDTLGRKVWEKTREKASSSPNDVRIMAYHFDDAGHMDRATQVMDVVHWLADGTDPQSQNLVTRYGYDSTGNKLWQQDALGVDRELQNQSGNPRKTYFGYDVAGRMVWRKLPMGQVEHTTYDNVTGRLLTTTDFNGKTTTYRYFGVAPQSGTASTEEQVPTTDRRHGELWYKQPDASLPEPGVTYDYYTDDDNQGRPWTATYGPIQTHYFYDERGQTRAVDTAFADGSLRPTRTLRYRYDLAGNKISTGVELWQSGATVPSFAAATAHAYDAVDRINAVGSKEWTPGGSFDENPGNWSGNFDTIAQYGYNAVGSLETVTRPGNATTHYAYNRRNELAWITHTPPSGAGDLGEAKAFAYESDLSGQRTKMFDGAEVALDGNGVPSPAANQPGTRYTYDKAGRLTQEERANGMTTVWTFDKVGNRLSQTVTWPSQPTQVTVYIYDDNDRLTEEVTSVGGTAASRKVYDWNNKGEMIWSGEQIGANVGSQQFNRQATYLYTFEGRLAKVTDGVPSSSSKFVLFQYDAAGNRNAIGRVTSDVENASKIVVDWTYQTVDTLQPYAEVAAEWSVADTSTNGGQTWRRGVWHLTARYDLGLDRLRTVQYETSKSGNITDRTVHGFLHDGLGSVRALVNASGARTDGYDFTAYGEPKTIAGSAGTLNKFLFNGQQYDGAVAGGATGLLDHVQGVENVYYLRARYYQPGNGRFTTQDAHPGINREPISLHRYIYGNDNAISYADPSGEFSISFTLGSVSGFPGRSRYDGAVTGIGLLLRKKIELYFSIMAVTVIPWIAAIPLEDTEREQKKDKPEIVFRALAPELYEPMSISMGIGIIRGNGNTSPDQHVMGGARGHRENPWVSSSRTWTWAYYWATDRLTKPANPIALIDLKKVTYPVFDVSTPAQAAIHLKHPVARNIAAAHREVLIRGGVNQQAIVAVISAPQQNDYPE